MKKLSFNSLKSSCFSQCIIKNQNNLFLPKGRSYCIDKRNRNCIDYVPFHFNTQNISKIEFEHNIKNLEFIPDSFKTDDLSVETSKDDVSSFTTTFKNKKEQCFEFIKSKINERSENKEISANDENKSYFYDNLPSQTTLKNKKDQCLKSFKPMVNDIGEKISGAYMENKDTIIVDVNEFPEYVLIELKKSLIQKEYQVNCKNGFLHIYFYS